ncbi:MAG TPA: glycosyltransferase family 87 protein [Solirubrobacterales bacterium]|nr:glycosyltransferase family 87 protein [Solirubrobacterales bacterium]
MGAFKWRFWIWLGVWLAGAALVVAEVGFWAGGHPRLEDVANYERWAFFLTGHGEFPGGHGWQYPPGAGWLMLVPRLVPTGYGEAWVGLMVLVDLVGLLLLARLAWRSGRDAGVWVWVLGIPLLGSVSVLRFDLVPTVIAIAALVVIHRRPGWFGALVGLGAAIKLWPALLLLGEWDRPRLVRSALVAAGVVVLVVVVSMVFFGDATGFLSNGNGRGLQEEAVATVPWHVGQIVSGDPYSREVRFGSWQIVGAGTRFVTDLLKVLLVAVLAGAATWWWYRAKAIRAGRAELADDAVSRDFVFAVVLGVVVTSPVLSPQYMIWLLGLAAVVLSAGPTRLRRPAWIVVGATALSAVGIRSSEAILIRDLALLFATVDAATTMVRQLSSTPGRSARRARRSSAGRRSRPRSAS